MTYSALRTIAALIVLSGLASCNTTAPTTPSPNEAATTDEPAADRPAVVATHSVLCDLTQQIAADTIDLQCMIEAGVDPHVYEPVPDDRRAIDTAQLILYGGYDFEPTLINLIEASSNTAPKVAVSEEAVPNPLLGGHEHGNEHAHGDEHGHEDEHAEGEHAEEDHAHGDAAEAPDPHVWHNAQNGIQMAEVIRRSLSDLSPENAQLYAQNTERLTAELTQIDEWIKAQIATIPAESRKLVTTHDALGYYAEAYDIEIAGALSGLSTEETPTAQRVRELVSGIEEAKVPTIFAEVSANPQLIETVAREANVKVSEQELFADGLGESGTPGNTYQTMLISNTEAIVSGLGGQPQPFQPQAALPRWAIGQIVPTGWALAAIVGGS